MSVSKLFDIIKEFGSKSDRRSSYDIPSIEFDASRLTETAKADIRKNITLLEDIDQSHAEQLYIAALRSISTGRDLSVLHNALIEMNIRGMTKRRATEIASLLNNKATAFMDRERQQSLGITSAVWLYSGAPCETNPKKMTGQDAAHKAANGKSFDISKGMFLDGKWTWPGVELGCRCVSKSLVRGFS